MLTAFKLYPLVEIVWADGSCDKAEAEAVIAAAEKLGVSRRAGEQSPSGLAAPRPDRGRTRRVEDVRREAARLLTPAELAEFRSDLHKHAVKVAEASGGFLDMFFQVSSNEKKIIAAIDQHLSAK